MKHLFTLLSILFFLQTLSGQMTLQDSLIAYYPMDGNALDASGNGNHGTIMGATLIADRFGNPNAAFEFDGVNDFIQVLDSQKFKPQLPVTISAWIQLHDYGLNMMFQNDYLENYYHGVWLNSGGGLIAGGIGNGGLAGRFARNEKLGTTVIPQFTWTHVAVVIRSGLDMDIYVNGVNDCGTYTGNGNNTLAYTTEDGAIGLSDSNAPTGPLNWFNGKMDDIRFYNRELSIAEIRTLAGVSILQTVNICSGDTSSLDASDGSFSYSWSPSLGLSCTNCANPTANPVDTTLYQVIRDNGFSCPDTVFFQVNVENCPIIPPCDTTLLQAGFNYTSNGLVLTIIDTSQGPDSGIDRWRWDFGDGNSRTVFMPDTLNHQYSEPGTYEVCLMVEKSYDELNVCLDTFCQFVMVDSISSGFGEDLSELGWNIYPNPTTNAIFLEKNEPSHAPIEVEIFSLTGKSLYHQSFMGEQKLSIPASFLAKGIYMLRVKNEGIIGYWKFIKE